MLAVNNLAHIRQNPPSRVVEQSAIRVFENLLGLYKLQTLDRRH